jgi:NAD(P)-dependent dehydrogenase (short-subunit alcohol dehydrogenase family)
LNERRGQQRPNSQRRVAAVTGAGSGIGARVALRLAEDAFDVAVIDVDQRNPGSARAFAVDVRRAEAVSEAFDAIEGWRKAPDVLVNSAGTMHVVPLTECAAEDFRRVMDVNVLGTFLCSQRAARGMIAQRYGRIANLTSVSRERAGIGRVAYGTSRAAVSGLTRQLAMVLGCHGVTANAVAPGPVSTPMTEGKFTPETRRAYESMIPARRLGTVEEMADTIAFLVSESAGYINGVTLAVDGGYLAAGVATTAGLQA